MAKDSLATLASRIAEARAAIAASRFARWTNAIVEQLEPSVRLEPLEGHGFGRSRFGGEPSLPVDVAWPAGSSGRPLDFVAQIDLGDVTKVLGAHRLPASGLLCFFVFEGEGRLVHLTNDRALATRPTPEGATRHRGCGLYLSPEVCLPRVETLYDLGLFDEPDDWGLQWEVLTRAVQSSDRAEHRFLGIATPPQEPFDRWAETYPGDPSMIARIIRQKLMEGRFTNEPGVGLEFTEGASVLLLQLDSDPTGPGWTCGDRDDGRLYLHVDAEDLEPRGLEAPLIVAPPGATLKKK